jgi:hypothetical protein
MAGGKVRENQIVSFKIKISRLVSTKRDFICKLNSKPIKIVPLFFDKLK